MAYTKLFASIVHSTIWRESNETRLVWVTMLALANRDGEVEASIPGLADAARVSISECERALAVLAAPDQYSRSKVEDGRRIREIKGGWFIINHPEYRERASLEEGRIKAARRKARQRARERDGHGLSREVTRVTESHDKAEASPEAEANRLNLMPPPKDLTGSARATPPSGAAVRCGKTRTLPEETLATLEVQIGMPKQDGLRLCQHFAEMWDLGEELKAEASWRKAMYTAVKTAWMNPNERQKLVRPPALRVAPGRGFNPTLDDDRITSDQERVLSEIRAKRRSAP